MHFAGLVSVPTVPAAYMYSRPGLQGNCKTVQDFTCNTLGMSKLKDCLDYQEKVEELLAAVSSPYELMISRLCKCNCLMIMMIAVLLN